MKIISGTSDWKEEILRILDDFREFCIKNDNPNSTLITNTATLHGGELFDKLIHDLNYKILIVIEQEEIIGIITGFLMPQLRKGEYCVEIEEFFVKGEFQGKGIASMLMENMENWGKEKGALSLRLESGNNLSRGHAFYEKYGFISYGKAFQKKIQN